MQPIDYVSILAYFCAVIYIGIRTKKSVRDSEDFFLSGRSLPVTITSLAFVAANMGSFELMGASANAAKYGMVSAHLAWIGCVPAMIFSGIVMVRFFYGSKVRSVPEYLRLRFDEKTRALNAISFAILTIFSSGLSLYGLAVVFHALLGWNIDLSIWVSALTVLAYVFLGGLRASIYSEVLQFILIIGGMLPLSIMILYSFGGLPNLLSQLPVEMRHTWLPVLNPEGTPYGGGVFSIAVCLVVASFAYWSTDFLVVQRALAAKDLATAQRTPLVAAFPRMLLPFITMVPGLAALIVMPDRIAGNYNMATPLMLQHYYPSGMLGVGVTAMLASFMSGMAGNVTAFNTVWTYDIYQNYIAPNRGDRHYLNVGRFVTFGGIFLSIGAAYTASGFPNIFDYWALISTIFVVAPFGTFLLGVFTTKLNGNAAFAGMLAGIATTVGHFALYRMGWLQYGSDLVMDFYGGFYGFAANILIALLLSAFDRPPDPERLRGLTYATVQEPSRAEVPWHRSPKVLAWAAAVMVIALNLLYW
jgi:SSS family solute:Na+ symporter